MHHERFSASQTRKLFRRDLQRVILDELLCRAGFLFRDFGPELLPKAFHQVLEDGGVELRAFVKADDARQEESCSRPLQHGEASLPML